MFIFLSQLFAFLSFLICLYILTVSLIQHSIWEKVALYNRGFIVPQDGFVTKINFYVNIFSTNDSLTYFFYTYNILPKKISKVAKISLCVSPMHIDVLWDFHIYQRSVAWMMIQYISIWILLKSMKNDDSIYSHSNPFEGQRFRRKCQEKPFHREIWDIGENDSESWF